MQTSKAKRPVGRPPSNGPRHVTLSVRMTPEMAAQLRQLAAEGDRSLSREFVRAIKAHLKAAGKTP